MGQDNPYVWVIVETYQGERSGHRGELRVRRVRGQELSPSLLVECPRKMRRDYPVGTLFKLKAKLTDKQGGTSFLYSHHSWPVEVMTEAEAEAFIAKHGGVCPEA